MSNIEKGKNKYLYDELNRFVNSNNNEGVFYINGLWGSGKSHFIKSFKDDYDKTHDDKSLHSIYISLDGMKSIDELNKEIYCSCHPKLSKISTSKVLKTIFTIGKGVGNFFGIDGERPDELVDNIASFFDSSCAILILDDFERCRIDLKEIFGFINSIVVNKKTKVILIGNEEEVIRHLQAEPLFQNKTIAALLSDNKKDYIELKNDKSLLEPLEYDLIKEKTVAEQYNFIFDSDILFDSIALEYDESIVNLLLEMKSAIKELIGFYQCTNFRTCKKALNIYARLINKVNKEIEHSALKNILCCCFIYSILNETKQDDEEFDPHEFGGFLIYPMSSVKDYVSNMIWDEEKFYSEVKAIGDIDKRSKPKTIKTLDDFWFKKTDAQLTEEIKKLIEETKECKIPIPYYKKVLYYVAAYQVKYKFDLIISLDDLCKIMVSNIQKTKDLNISDDRSIYVEKTKLLEGYYKQIDDAIFASVLNQSIDGPSQIIDKLKKSQNDIIKDLSVIFMKNKSFIASIDPEGFYNEIITCSSIEVVNIRRSLSMIYSFSNLYEMFPADKTNVDILINLLTNHDFVNENIKRQEVKYLVSDLEKYSKQLIVPKYRVI